MRDAIYDENAKILAYFRCHITGQSRLPDPTLVVEENNTFRHSEPLITD